MKIRDLKPKQKKDVIKVLWYSNSPHLPTGFAKVTREVCKRLSFDSHFEVTVIGEHLMLDPTSYLNFKLVGFKVPIQMPDGKQPSPADICLYWINQIKPDIFITLEDTFTLDNQEFLKMEALRHEGLPFMIYTPFDGGGIPSTGIPISRLATDRVSMAKFTQQEFAIEGFDSDMIWHGVDLEQFYPVTDEEQKQLKTKYGFKPDDFVVFTYMRNSARKAPQRNLQILCEFLKDKPNNVKAFAHIMNYNVKENDLEDYKERVLSRLYSKNVIDRLFYSIKGRMVGSGFNPETAATDKEVAEYLQLSDILMSATTGEGFGLIMSEGMACNKPLVMTDYTTPQELIIDVLDDIKPRGIIVPYDTTITASYNTVHAFVNKEKFVEALNTLYESKELREQYGKNGRPFAEKFLNWDYLAEDWKKIIRKAVE